MKRLHSSHGYYSLTILPQPDCLLLGSNSERAAVVALLQDLLSPRFLISEAPAHQQLSSCIDLLGFSIRSQQIQLILFSIDRHIVTRFGELLMDGLSVFRDRHFISAPPSYLPPILRATQLQGPHQALDATVALHLLHEDWEYDRYSSIGFYLHDRRGDWMRIWRLTRLYGNESQRYRTLLYTQVMQSPVLTTPRLSLAP